MVVGLGIDVVELDRIRSALDRHGRRFIDRVLTPAERGQLSGRSPVPFVAVRFAAKEAAAKALGTGLRDGVGFQTLQILSEASGKPRLELLAGAREQAERLGAQRCHVSLTHGRDTAAAVVVLESTDF